MRYVEAVALTVRSTLEPLATDTKLAFKVEMATELPLPRAQAREGTVGPGPV